MIILRDPQFAWLLWSLFLIVIWGIIYMFLRSKESRKEMLTVSLWTSLLGLTEPLFVTEYWNPPSLFDLAHRTGFDIESFIFSFGIGGIAVVLYEWIFKTKHEQLSVIEHHHPRHKIHILALISAPVIFILFYLFGNLNPIYSAIIALMGGGLFTWYCRPDLMKRMLISALIFLGIYFIYFLTLIVMYPSYVERVWNLSAISGILFFGVPLEEMLFALSFGFYWASIYEHLNWYKIIETKQL